ARAQGVDLQTSMDALGQITSVDANSGRVLISPNAVSNWGPTWVPIYESLPPQRTLIERPDGFDIVYSFHNTGTTPRSVGSFYLPGIRFGQVVQMRDFLTDGKVRVLDHQNQNYFGGGNVYPGSWYSPAMVVSDGDYTIGVSLQFPLLDYKHHTFIRMESPGGASLVGGRNWMVRFDVNPTTNVDWMPLFSWDGEIPPGGRRTYTMTVRVQRSAAGQHPQSWLRTLNPYREYFQCTYGAGPQYTRDPRPVLGQSLAFESELGPSNTLGFAYSNLRPDVNGWGPWRTLLDLRANQGWNRITLWAPTGLFNVHRNRNFPFLFTSHWQNVPAIRDSLSQLAGFAGPSGNPTGQRRLGLWWGRAAEVMNTWDPAVSYLLDPARPDHRAAAVREMNGAVAVNATDIGLDTFIALPQWKGYGWLNQLRATYPGAKFIVEPMPSDLLHTLGAGFMIATRPANEQWLAATNPHYLADFLVPGHETWGSILHVEPSEFGLPPGSALSDANMRTLYSRVAGWGYVPQTYTPAPLTAPLAQWNAAQTWTTTVPLDLQGPAEPVFTTQPSDRTVELGGATNFKANAESSQTIDYQWFFNDQPLSDSTRIAGSHGPVLSISSIMHSDVGAYRVIVSTACTAASSMQAYLRIDCVADFNGDGFVEPGDLDEYITAFFSGDSMADINGDGFIEPGDLDEFVTLFFDGCSA
ncbi:MAG: immunoglobulin domain-containing protein, partial [Phycisphaerales bacterium]